MSIVSSDTRAAPPLALSLLGLDENSSRPGRDLARIIESDPILTARMLGLANSVAFAGSAKPIFKVSEAIARLGVDTVLTAAFSQLAAKWLRGTCKFPDPALMSSFMRSGCPGTRPGGLRSTATQFDRLLWRSHGGDYSGAERAWTRGRTGGHDRARHRREPGHRNSGGRRLLRVIGASGASGIRP